MEESYAAALWQAIEGGIPAKEAVARMQKALAARGRQGLMPRIGKAFARLAERKRVQHTLTLTIADAADGKRARKEASAALEAMGVSVDGIEEVVDKTLVGGWRIEGREHLVDASFKQQLISLYNRATRA